MVLERLRDGCTKWPNERLAWQQHYFVYTTYPREKSVWTNIRQENDVGTAETSTDCLRETNICLSVCLSDQNCGGPAPCRSVWGFFFSFPFFLSQMGEGSPRGPVLITLMLTVLITSEAHTARSLQKFLFKTHCQAGCWTVPAVPVTCSQASDIFHRALRQHQQRAKLRHQGGTFLPEVALTNRKSCDTISHVSFRCDEISREQVSSLAQWWGSGHIQKLSKAGQRQSLQPQSSVRPQASERLVSCPHFQLCTGIARNSLQKLFV